MPAKIYCYNCSNEIGKNDFKCPFCGAPIKEDSSKRKKQISSLKIKSSKKLTKGRSQKETETQPDAAESTVKSTSLKSIDVIKHGFVLFKKGWNPLVFLFLGFGFLGSLLSQALGVFILNPTAQIWFDILQGASDFNTQFIALNILLLLTFPDLILALIFTVFSSSITILYSLDFLNEKQPNFLDALKRTTTVLIPITIISLFVRILVIIGSLFFIIPGALFSVWFAVFLPVILVEGKKWFNSLRRSFSLTNSNFLKTLSLVLYFILLRLIITPETTALVRLILYGVDPWKFGFFPIEPIGFLLGGIIGPIEYTTTTILYLTLAQTKEITNESR
jgi:hypothetical protein